MQATHTPTRPTSITTDVVLRNAALYLDRHGWTQIQFFDLTADTAFPPACAAGAISIVVQGRCVGNDSHLICAPATGDALPALRDFAAWLDPDYHPDRANPTEVIGDWNDHFDRTRREVIDALRAAADDYTAIATRGLR